MIRNSRRFMAPGSLLAVGLLVLSCGKESSNEPGNSSSARQDEQFEGGTLYKSQLLPLNSIVADNSLGVLSLELGSSKLKINLSMTNTPEDLEHFQAIHKGSQCPNDSADINVDGIIDMSELEKVSGPLLFTLNSDLSSKERGDFSTSRSNEYGNYTYWADVRINDFSKFNPGFSPENKVVVVYGINQNYNLPSSTFAFQGSKHRYVPISCGVIKVSSIQNLH